MNDLGLKLLKSFESCRLEAYRDIRGVLTIGWGHTGADVTEGLIWTQDQADSQLVDDLSSFEDHLDCELQVQLTDDQFSALVDFVYNLGSGALLHSTLLKKINSGDFYVSGEFVKWDHSCGKEIEGLLTRRKAEAALFASDYDAVNDILAKRS